MLPISITSLRTYGRARLFLTTALISLAAFPLVPAVLYADVYLDNVDPGDGNIETESGLWASFSNIWTDENGENAGPMTDTEIGVLTGEPGQDITLRMSGTIDAGGLRVESGNYTLARSFVTGGRLRAGGSALAFSVAEGLDFRVEADLQGNMTLAGGGRMIIAGNAVGGITTGANSDLLIEGRSTGAIVNAGQLAVEGEHDGNIVNSGTAALNGEVDGNVRNLADAQITLGGRITDQLDNYGTVTVDDDARLGSLLNRQVGTVLIEEDGRLDVSTEVDNRGTITIEGTLDADVANTNRLNLAGGDLDGSVTNTGVLQGNGHVIGNVTNNVGGTVSTGAGGALHLGGLTNSGGTVNVGAGQTLRTDAVVENTGQFNLDGRLESGVRNDAGGTLAMGADARVTGNVGNTGQLNLAGSVNGTVQTGGPAGVTVTAGDATVRELITTGGGTTTIGAGHVVTSTEQSENRGGQTNIAGTLQGDFRNGSGTTTMQGGTVDGNVTNASAMNGNGRITGTLTNTGTMAAQGELQVGALDNNGTLNVGAGSTVTADDAISNSGNLNVRGGTVNVTGNGGLTNEAAGTLQLVGATVNADVDNQGTIQVNTDSSVTGDLTNSGTINMNSALGDVTLDVGGTFANSGNVNGSGPNAMTISAGLVEIRSGSSVTNVNIIGDLLNRSDVIYDQDRFLDGNLTNERDGSVTVSAQLDMRGNELVNRGDFTLTTDSNSSGSLIGVVGLTNGGNFTIGTGTTATAQTVVNRGTGMMEVGGTLNATAPVQNDADMNVTGRVNADIDNTDDLRLTGGTVAGSVTNDGRLVGNGTVTGDVTNNVSMSLNGRVQGSVINNGTITQNGTLNVGGLTNNERLVVNTNGVLQSTTVIQNNDRILLSGRIEAGVNNSAAGNLQFSGGTVAGDVVNAGGMTGTGTVTGALANSGTATIGGRVNGAVTNSGTLTSVGTLNVASLVNSSTVNVAAGSTLVSGAAVQNDGRLNVAGRLQSDLVNTGETQLANGTVTGAVTNRGTLSGQGTLGGALVNSTGATVDMGGRVVGALTNDGALSVDGTLRVGSLANNAVTNVAAGNTLVSDGTVTNNESITVGGTLQGDIANAGGLTLANGTVRGDVVNDSVVTGAGTIEGTLVNNAELSFGGRIQRLENAGSVNMTGDLSVGELVNDSLISVQAGRTLTTDAALLNRDQLNVAGTLAGDLDNRATTTLNQGRIDGTVVNRGTLSGSGTITETLANTGTLNAAGNLTVNQLVNDEVATIAAGGTLNAAQGVVNRDRFNVAGTLNGDLMNQATAQASISGGTVRGDVGNLGTLTSQGNIEGLLQNAGTASLGGSAAQIQNLAEGQIDVSGGLRTEGFLNAGATTIGAGDRLAMLPATQGGQAAAFQNLEGGRLTVGGTLAGSVANAGNLTGSGRIDGSVLNQGTTNWNGSIGGALRNEAVANLGGSLGELVNADGTVTTRGTLDVARTVSNLEGANIDVANGTTLIAQSGVLNRGTFRLNGDLQGDVLNQGNFNQSGTLTGSLQTSGTAVLDGAITGNLIYDGGQMTANDGLTIGGDFVLNENYRLEAGRSISANRTVVDQAAALTLGGNLSGQFVNQGRVNVVGNQATIDGALTNNGTISLADGNAGGALTVGGMQGTGTYAFDLNLADMTSDRIVVEGGAARGAYTLDLSYRDQDATPEIGARLTLIDVDESFGSENDFTIRAHTDLPALSERFVYSLDRQDGIGDLELVSQTNPAIGAIFGNVALTQSLIGSVINRPTSPFVTSLAYEDKERPCGVGSWARVTGGTAKADGATDNGVSKVNSEIDASYYGMQVGTDLACFDNRFGGWAMAFGALGGINRGDTTQPVYAIDPNNSQNVTGLLTSITKADFEQRYAGVYMTATKGRVQADLQYRLERTDFTLENTPVIGAGLGLGKTDFSSDSQTLSGSVSYGIPIGQNGWAVLPTVGFAWSKLSTDSITFDDGYQLSFEDGTRKIGFVGATVAKTFVQAGDNSALYAFATGTYYKDFADPTISVFGHASDAQFEPQSLKSDNLGAYGEVSVGANWIKVLGPEARGRQLSASARIDARFGEQLDSVGVSGQLRWQF